MDTESTAELARSLEHFSGAGPRDVRNISTPELERVNWLFDEGMLKNSSASTSLHPDFLNMSITAKGMDFLKKHRNVQPEKSTSEARYEKDHPITVKVFIGIAMALIGSVIAWFIHRL